MLTTIRARLAALAVIAVTGVLLAGVLAYTTVATVSVDGTLGKRFRAHADVVQNSYPPGGYLGQLWGQVAMLQSETEPAAIRALGERMAKDIDTFHRMHTKWREEVTPGPLKDALDKKLFVTGEAIAVLLNKDLIPAARRGENNFNQLLAEELTPLFLEHEKASAATAIELDKVSAQIDALVANTTRQRNSLLIGGVGRELKTRHLMRRWRLMCASTWRPHAAPCGAAWNVVGHVPDHRAHPFGVRPNS